MNNRNELTQEINGLKRSVRRLWGTLVGLALVSTFLLVALGWIHWKTPGDILVEGKNSGRAAMLTPEHLLITQDGEQRAVLDAQSGLIVRAKDGRYVRIDPELGVLLQEEDGEVRCAFTFETCVPEPDPEIGRMSEEAE